jgi:hypothetical protein
METCNPTRTPFQSIVPAKRAPCDQPTDTEQFCTITVSIMHLAVYTCPDIMFVASKLVQFNSNPSIQYYCTAKHLLHYIQGTKDLVSLFADLLLTCPRLYLSDSWTQALQQISTTANPPLATSSFLLMAPFLDDPTSKQPLCSPSWKPNTLHSQKPPKE